MSDAFDWFRRWWRELFFGDEDQARDGLKEEFEREIGWLEERVSRLERRLRP